MTFFTLTRFVKLCNFCLVIQDTTYILFLFVNVYRYPADIIVFALCHKRAMHTVFIPIVQFKNFRCKRAMLHK